MRPWVYQYLDPSLGEFRSIKREVALRVDICEIIGNWRAGYALDKHTLSSEFLGHNEYGHAMFDTTRSEVGEAVYQLKYKKDWDQANPLATAIVKNIVPLLGKVHVVIPVPASTVRNRQPVYEVSRLIASQLDIESFEGIVTNTSVEGQVVALKNLDAKADKVEALKQRLALNDEITNDDCWNALVVDDIYDTGASLEAVCDVLRAYRKIDEIYVATLTWR